MSRLSFFCTFKIDAHVPNMNEHRCKGCLIDSTHGKLQKKKEALLEFIFAENSLCLTVSAQNVNIMAYTLSHETLASVVSNNDLLVINFKAKKQIKISAMAKTKLVEFKALLDALLTDDSDGKRFGCLRACVCVCNELRSSLPAPCRGLLQEFTGVQSCIEIESECGDDDDDDVDEQNIDGAGRSID